MEAAEILTELSSRGVSVTLAGQGKVRITPKEAIDDDIRAMVRLHKPELLAGLYGVTLTEIAERMGDDMPEVLGDPALLDVVAHAIRDRKMRERGERPPGYDVRGTCNHCGPVWLHGAYSEGATVPCCMWCFNRLKGRPVPRP